MKYPIHYDDSFKKNLVSHASVDVFDSETQSSDGLLNILVYLLNKDFQNTLICKLDVNIFHRMVKLVHHLESSDIEFGLEKILFVFPSWHLLEHLIKMTVKNLLVSHKINSMN